MNIEILQSLGINVLPAVVVALLTQAVKKAFISKKIINHRKKINFFLPLPISIAVTFIFLTFIKHTSGNIFFIFLQNVIIFWAFSSFIYQLLQKLLPDKTIKIEVAILTGDIKTFIDKEVSILKIRHAKLEQNNKKNKFRIFYKSTITAYNKILKKIEGDYNDMD